MTVAKGSGERREIPRAGSPAGARTRRDGANATYTRTLDLAALGLAPGDRTLFPRDRHGFRTPKPNQARSETTLRYPARTRDDHG